MGSERAIVRRNQRKNETMKLTSWIATGLACAGFGLGTVRAADETNKTNAVSERIGVYDSRVIAYAGFWTEAHQRWINETVRNAKEAKAAGQAERFNELNAALKKEQEQGHLQVFSAAPVDNVLAEMKDRLPEIRKEAGVSRLVSKWDEKTLNECKRAEQVDVTDLLLREFKLNDKQRKMVEDMRTKMPLPLKEAEKLLREGKL
jgi:hypothetical protein